MQPSMSPLHVAVWVLALGFQVLNATSLAGWLAAYGPTTEAAWAATAGGARALRRDDVGVLAPGKRADLILLDAPTRTHLAYRPGVPLVSAVWVGGRAT